MADEEKRSILSTSGDPKEKDTSRWEKLKKRSKTSGFGFNITLGSFERRGKPPVKVQFETKLKKFKPKRVSGEPLTAYNRGVRGTSNKTKLHTGFRIKF